MRANFVIPALLLALTLAAPVHADSPKVAVFDLELIDTSAEGDAGGSPAGEHDRLMRAGQQLRRELAESGKFQLLGKYAKADFTHGRRPSYNQKTTEVNFNYVMKQFNARLMTFYRDTRFNRERNDFWQVGVGLQVQM